MAKNLAIGKGMDALLFENSSDESSSHILRISDIEPNKSQPRIDFEDEAIETLADSINQHGLLQPLLVRPLSNGMYQIVAGERRWRACRMLGLDEIPVIIKEFSDKETMQVALIENLQRENLNPIEEALGYKDLIDTFNMTQDAVSKTVGKSRSVVANSLRILSLPKVVQDFVRSGDLSLGHAKVLAGVQNEQICIELAGKCKADLLTVRALEKIIANISKAEKPEKIKQRDSFFTEIEVAIKQEMGRNVKVNESKKGGTIQIEFFDKDDLTVLANAISVLKK